MHRYLYCLCIFPMDKQHILSQNIHFLQYIRN